MPLTSSASRPARLVASLISLAAAVLAGCATTNDSGVTLHPKPDLSSVFPGTPVGKVAALRNPARKEPLIGGDNGGAEVWVYEWDLPNDGVNNRMFTHVVVKDGVIVSFREQTADKWRQDVDLHRIAKVDSALEDVAYLKQAASRGLGSQSPAPDADSWQRLLERTRALERHSTLAAGADERDVMPGHGHGTPDVPPAMTGEVSAGTNDEAQSPTSLAAALPPKKTLRELEAEELQIRKDSSLTKKERMRRLHEVWKLQREVMAGGALAEN